MRAVDRDAGRVTRPPPDHRSDEAPTAENGQGFKGNETAGSLNCAARFPAEASGKAFATLRARLAPAGWALSIVDVGSGRAAYLVSRWGRSRTLPDIEAVRAFAAMVGVPT